MAKNVTTNKTTLRGNAMTKNVTITVGEKVFELDDSARAILQDALEAGIDAYDEANRDFEDEDEIVEVPEILRTLVKEL